MQIWQARPAGAVREHDEEPRERLLAGGGQATRGAEGIITQSAAERPERLLLLQTGR